MYKFYVMLKREVQTLTSRKSIIPKIKHKAGYLLSLCQMYLLHLCGPFRPYLSSAPDSVPKLEVKVGFYSPQFVSSLHEVFTSVPDITNLIIGYHI